MITNDIQPELAQSIKDNLHAWKYHLPPPFEHPTNQILCQAIRVQNRIGWKSFIKGFWSLHWRECQEAHFQEIKSNKSAMLWLSKTQRKIWHIAWEMWQHRNNVLHDNNKSIHPTVRNSLITEITLQWQEGISTLPARYTNLFQGTLEAKLRADPAQQRAWLHSVWAARTQFNSTYFESTPTVCDQTLRHKFNQWKAKSNASTNNST